MTSEPIDLEREFELLRQDVEQIKMRVADALQGNKENSDLLVQFIKMVNGQFEYAAAKVDECFMRVVPPEKRAVIDVEEAVKRAVEKQRDND